MSTTHKSKIKIISQIEEVSMIKNLRFDKLEKFNNYALLGEAIEINSTKFKCL